MSDAAEARVPCSYPTKDRLRAAKRGGQTYDELFQAMLQQYDPDVARASDTGERTNKGRR